MSRNEREVLEEHHAWVSTDNPFQRRARLMQATWREAAGLPIGRHRDRPLGSRLDTVRAEAELDNYLTDRIRDVVRREVLDPVASAGKLYARPRIFNDLLSSQPACFNLFGELQLDLGLATRALSARLPSPGSTVTAIRFEHSPGRGDPRFTEDNSAFDVFVEYAAPAGRRGFVGIEVKYHEDLSGKAARHRARYDEVADRMGVFVTERRGDLREQPLQQIWRDHLLAGSTVLAEIGFDEGSFAFLYPRGNVACRRGVEAYGACLTDERSFAAWTLEDLVDDVERASAGPWIRAFRDRYLAFERLPAPFGTGGTTAGA